MDDFNMHLPEIQRYFATLGILIGFENGTKTHNLGNNLDTIFTN